MPPSHRCPALRHGGDYRFVLDLEDPVHAYYCGLVQTDGHLRAGSRNRGSVTIELAERDSSVLHELHELLPWTSTVTERTRHTNFADKYTSVSLRICAHDLRAQLVDVGIPEGPKSATAAPLAMPRATERDYLRGLIDGDGSVSFTSRDEPFVSFTTQSEELVRYAEQRFGDISGASRHSGRTTRDGVFNPMWLNDPSVSIAGFLYENVSVALARKKEAANQLMRWTRPQGMRARPRSPRRPYTEEEDALLLTSGLPTSRLAELTGRSPGAVSARRWRLRRGQASLLANRHGSSRLDRDLVAVLDSKDE